MQPVAAHYARDLKLNISSTAPYTAVNRRELVPMMILLHKKNLEQPLQAQLWPDQ